MTLTAYNGCLKRRGDAIINSLGFDVSRSKWYLVGSGRLETRRRVAYGCEYWLRTSRWLTGCHYEYAVVDLGNDEWYLLVLKKSEFIRPHLFWSGIYVKKIKIDLSIGVEENIIMSDMECL